MGPEKPRKLPTKRPPVFAISCWVLALMAFSQLLVAGLALATRFEDSRVVKVVIKEVPKYVPVRISAAAAEPPGQVLATVVSRPPPPVASLPLPAPTPVRTPEVSDPRSERLIKEARQARVAGDMMRAIVKLEEALNQSPEDPSVHYELGLVHEQMGVNDTAAAHYEKVFQMGVSGAGALYELAATKLREGFDEPSPLGKLSLGRVREFEDPDSTGGQRIVLTIPVQKAPGEAVNADKVSVEILFFNRTDKGEILMREEQDTHAEQWMNPPFDWISGDEVLRSTYTIPVQDRQTDHLFGQRTYYGQVVILHYGDQVVDVQARPRDLAARIPNPQGNPANLLLPTMQDMLPADVDPDLGVLPKK
jgi:TPR repeat